MTPAPTTYHHVAACKCAGGGIHEDCLWTATRTREKPLTLAKPDPGAERALEEMRDEHVMENDLRRRDVLRWADTLEAIRTENAALKERVQGYAVLWAVAGDTRAAAEQRAEQYGKSAGDLHDALTEAERQRDAALQLAAGREHDRLHEEEAKESAEQRAEKMEKALEEIVERVRQPNEAMNCEGIARRAIGRG